MSIVETGGSNVIGTAARSEQLYKQSRDEGPNAEYLDRPRFEQLWRVAEMFASSDLVPAHFQGKPGNCFIAAQLAFRFGMDPFMVMQNCYVVSGRPGFEGKFVIALINTSKLFQDPLEYTFGGEPLTDDWQVKVSAKRTTTGKVCETIFRYTTVKLEGWTKNPKWRSMPEQMMMYRGAAFFSRVFCPEVIMGMQTREELEDIDEPQIRPAKAAPSLTQAIDSLGAPSSPVKAPIDPGASTGTPEKAPITTEKGALFDPNEIASMMDK